MYTVIDKTSIIITSKEQDNVIDLNYGQELDLTQFEIKYNLKYKKDSVKVKNPTMQMIEGFNPEYIGKQDITITYKGVDYHFEVNVHPVKLDTPYIQVANNVLSWSQIENAKEYNIIYGPNKDDMKVLDNISNLEYDISNLSYYGYCYFAVKAIKNDEKFIDSDNSNIIKTLKLEKVENIHYENSKITWDKVDLADSYKVLVNGNEFTGLTTNEFEYKLSTGINKIQIYAYSNIENSIFSISDEYQFEILTPVNNIFYENGYIVWDKVKEADSYDVKINGKLVGNYIDNKFSLSTLKEGIYDISFISKSNKNNFSNSTETSFKILANFNIDVQDNKIVWNNIQENNVFHIIINDEINTNQITNNFVSINDYIVNPGKYNIKIKYVSKDDVKFAESNSITITKLSTPVIKVVNNKLVSDNSKLNVKYFLNGVEFDGNLNTIKQSGKYDITGKYIASNKYELDSLVSNTLTITKHKAPVISIKNGKLAYDNSSLTIKYYIDGAEFDGSLDKISCGEHRITAKYIATTNAEITSDLSNELVVNKYKEPNLTIKNGKIISEAQTTNLKFYLDGKEFNGDLTNINKAGRYAVTAKAISKDNINLDSNMSKQVYVVKLASPVLSIVDKKLTHNLVNNNIKYYLNGKEFDGDLTKIKTPGKHNITAKYTPKALNELESNLSDVLTVNKIEKPLVTVNNQKIVLDQDKYDVLYYLDGVKFDGDLNKITVSGEHKITVKYIAKINTDLDSEMSEEAVINKLASPSIFIENKVVKVNGSSNNIKYYLDGKEFDGDLSNIKIPGKYKVTAKYFSVISSNLDSEESKAIIVNKLNKPTLSLVDGKISCDLTEHTIKYYLNGLEFDGNVSSFEEGTYTIKAKYLGSLETELDSELTSFIINRLPKPIIQIVNHTLAVDKEFKVEYYLDGKKFDGNLDNLSGGTHVISAKYIASEPNELDSLMSANTEVHKLLAPSLIYQNGKIVAKNGSSIEYYYDDKKFDGNYKSLPEGNHIVYAINKGLAEEDFDSVKSNELKLYVFNGQIRFEKSGSNIINAGVDTRLKNVKYDIKIEFYLSGKLIDTYNGYNRTRKIETIIYNRGSQIADFIKLQYIFYSDDISYESSVYETSYTIK